jgi:sugar phosphate isomerase/epimerase
MAGQLAIGVVTGMRDDMTAHLNEIKKMGIATIQLVYPPDRLDSDAVASSTDAIRTAVDATGIEITSIVCTYPGERYDDIPTVRRTVGFVPEDTRAERLATTRAMAGVARRLGVGRLCCHIGYIPEDPGDPVHQALAEALRALCADLEKDGLVFGLETGQETAAGLKVFLEGVGAPNLKVNFDPANMILYGSDRPLPAIETLIPWVDGVHFKDGKWPLEADQLGTETPLGEGQVDIPAFTAQLLTLGYRGPLTIEREIGGEQQKRDIIKARLLIEDLVGRYGPRK